jgi:DNA-binding XRE family transcriptional regulator
MNDPKVHAEGEPPIREPEGTLACTRGLYRIPGWIACTVSLAFKPKPEECRQMLRAMRSRADLSRGQLAALLGVQLDILRRWEEGRRTPCAAARRLIQLVHLLYFHPDRIGAFLPSNDALVALFQERRGIRRGCPVPAV